MIYKAIIEYTNGATREIDNIRFTPTRFKNDIFQLLNYNSNNVDIFGESINVNDVLRIRYVRSASDIQSASVRRVLNCYEDLSSQRCEKIHVTIITKDDEIITDNVNSAFKKGMFSMMLPAYMNLNMNNTFKDFQADIKIPMSLDKILNVTFKDIKQISLGDGVSFVCDNYTGNLIVKQRHSWCDYYNNILR